MGDGQRVLRAQHPPEVKRLSSIYFLMTYLQTTTEDSVHNFGASFQDLDVEEWNTNDGKQ
jgi:hypothetical protein